MSEPRKPEEGEEVFVLVGGYDDFEDRALVRGKATSIDDHSRGFKFRLEHEEVLRVGKHPVSEEELLKDSSGNPQTSGKYGPYFKNIDEKYGVKWAYSLDDFKDYVPVDE
jgi:hypothetical protein